MKLLVYTDGGARGNPGPAGIGVAIYDGSSDPISTHHAYLGSMTNNQAEYHGALLGIQKAIEQGAPHIVLHMDSELVVKQLLGEYKIKNADLRSLYMDIQNEIGPWGGTLDVIHIPRAQNAVADALANVAMDTKCSSAT